MRLCEEPRVPGPKQQSPGVEGLHKGPCGCGNTQHASKHVDICLIHWISVVSKGVPTLQTTNVGSSDKALREFSFVMVQTVRLCNKRFRDVFFFYTYHPDIL